VKCWGANGRGQLGLGDARDRGLGAAEMGDALAALELSGAGPITKISVGQDHACALGVQGDVFCWGANGRGQLGTETTDDVGTVGGPTRPHLGAGIVIRDLALGRAHTCVLDGAGAVYCFGNNDFGQLGLGHARAIGDRRGTMGDAMQPVALGEGFHVKAISSGSDHVCAISHSGRIKCWGAAAAGALGLGDTRDRGTSAEDLGDGLPMVDLGHGQFVTDVSCGSRHCCARTIQNTAKCWGDNAHGQLGLGDLVSRGTDPGSMGDSLPFLLTPPHERVLSIQAAGDRTCIRTESGLRCWGRNRAGELGYGDRQPRGGTPTTVPRALSPLGI
jgi:alpha-tubulin suppressor-like RCC1 family protein